MSFSQDLRNSKLYRKLGNNTYLRVSEVANEQEEETPLEMPLMNFDEEKNSSESKKVDDAEEALELPKMW